MAQYHFVEGFRAPNCLRVKQALMFMKLMKSAFNVEAWVDADDHTVRLTEQTVEHALRSRVSQSELEKFGVTWIVKSTGTRLPLLLCIATGGDEWCENSFNLDFSRTEVLPDLSYFRKAIESLCPFEAFIFDEKNDEELRVRRQQQGVKSYGQRPTVLHWFHYMQKELATEVGGMSHCLKTPGFSVKEFSEGILFQLTAEPFDPDNPHHKVIQLQAMQHLGIA